jgi:hypothetical protein
MRALLFAGFLAIATIFGPTMMTARASTRNPNAAASDAQTVQVARWWRGGWGGGWWGPYRSYYGWGGYYRPWGYYRYGGYYPGFYRWWW